jgi:hypothetical protein
MVSSSPILYRGEKIHAGKPLILRRRVALVRSAKTIGAGGVASPLPAASKPTMFAGQKFYWYGSVIFTAIRR